MRAKFDASLSTMTRIGEKISFLKRTYQRLDDGILITPGHYIGNMLEVYGMVKAQQVPIQVEDVPLELDSYESTIYRSLVGMAIYLFQERLDTSFTVKELQANNHCYEPSQEAFGILEADQWLFNEATETASLPMLEW